MTAKCYGGLWLILVIQLRILHYILNPFRVDGIQITACLATGTCSRQRHKRYMGYVSAPVNKKGVALYTLSQMRSIRLCVCKMWVFPCEIWVLATISFQNVTSRNAKASNASEHFTMSKSLHPIPVLLTYFSVDFVCTICWNEISVLFYSLNYIIDYLLPCQLSIIHYHCFSCSSLRLFSYFSL